MQLLQKHDVQSVLVPFNSTDKLQPFDLMVNKVAKSYLQRDFKNGTLMKYQATLIQIHVC